MELRETILGLLSWKPASGYDLKRIIADSDVYYWSGNNNQIYKSLLELQKDGQVKYEVLLQENLPAKKIYSITDQGLAELHKSLLAEPQLPELHKNFLIQLAWAEMLSDGEIEGLLEHYEAELAIRLQMYQARAENSPARSARERFLWERIHANQLAACASELEWVRQTRLELNEKKYLPE